jgi:hypothetical protein
MVEPVMTTLPKLGAAWRASTVLAAVLAPLPAQHSLTLDAGSLPAPRAILDPTGTLELLSGKSGWRIRFVPFSFPAPGSYEVAKEPGAKQLRVALLDDRHEEQPLTRGRVEVTSITAERVRGVLEYASETAQARHRLAFDLVAALAPVATPQVGDQKPTPSFEPARDKPDPEDLVFCAFGRHGTGLPGQRMVAESIAKLAETGPLDLVFLLGDSFLPSGVQSVNDPQWREKFEDVYDHKRLPITFYQVAGAAEWAGRIEVVEGYGASHQRFCFKQPPGASFTMRSHGKAVAFFPADTLRIVGGLEDPRTRNAIRSVTQELELSKADWKIVLGYEGFRAIADQSLAARAEVMRSRFEHRLPAYRADVYVCASERVLQLFKPKDGVTYVTSGAGGGPELAASTRWTEDTVFAATGGGFTWFRFDGKELEVSFRDAAGKVLYVHRITKP